MKARKENKVYEVDNTTKDRYVKNGFDIYDDNGKLIKNANNKTVPYEQYEKIVKELKELKEKDKGEKGQKTKDLTVAEIKKQLDTLGIEYDKSATKADLLTLLPQKG